MFSNRYNVSIVLCILSIILITSSSFSKPIKLTDYRGKEVIISEKPKRVVSLVPSITEAIFMIGAGSSVKRITYHNSYPPQTALKKVAGGFFNPSVEEVTRVNPDIIFISNLQKDIIRKFGKGTKYEKSCVLINLRTNSVKDSFNNLKILGDIFNQEKEALEVIDRNKQILNNIKRKIAKIPAYKRKRIIRIMGRKKLRVPGDNSFQNEFIKLAGGIAPEFGRDGNIIDVTLNEWKKFNPQVIYGCGDDLNSVTELLKDSYNKKRTKLISFSCVLTCRASTNIGYFVSWLAAKIYPEEFGKIENQIFKDNIYRSKKIKIDLPYIKTASINYSYIHDFTNQTLIIDLKHPLSIVSTLEGYRSKIKRVGNHYSPAQTWEFAHKEGLKGVRRRVYNAIRVNQKNSSFLFTGARIENISVKSEKYKKIKVYALVTAGVRGNAQRMSRDNGLWYEPGTINILIMSNMKLSQRAMTRAIISATEAKTAALMDMDIRSSYIPKFKATGTGTDNILVCEGTGFPIDNAGGHTKMGELIAKAVYSGVKEAVFKQNGIVTGRNIFHRLKDRKLSISKIVNESGCECTKDKSKLYKEFEIIMLNPKYSSFLSMAFAISDDFEAGLIKDISFFNKMCNEITFEIAGKRVHSLKYKESKNLPLIIDMALFAILDGINSRK